VLIDLVQHRVGRIPIEGEVLGKPALRPRSWDLFDQNHDIRHDAAAALIASSGVSLGCAIYQRI
jgi:hypothetical protein